MTFIDGQVLTASQLNDLASKDDLSTAVEDKVNEINGYDLTAKQSAETALSSSQTAQTAMVQSAANADLAEAKGDNSATYATIALGLAATTSGKYFRVPSGNGDETLYTYYLNNSGSAVSQGILLSKTYFENRIVDVDSTNKMVALAVDEAGNVPIWIEDGKFNAVALHDDLLENAAAGVNNKIPLFADESDNVPLWLEGGSLNAVALHPNLIDYIQKNISVKETLITVSGGESLWRFRAKVAQIQAGVSQKVKIGFTGDSWTEHSAIPQSFANLLYPKLGKAGEGWIQLNIDNVNLINNVDLTYTNWNIYDASQTDTAPVYPTSMDGQYIYTAANNASMGLSNINVSSIYLVYYDGDATFRYSTNGGTPTTVVCGGTNQIVFKEISGLDVTTLSTVGMDTVGNTGTMVFYGFYANGTGTGIEIEKMGNGGITTQGYVKTLDYLTTTASFVDPDLLFIIIGTNDFRLSESLADFKSGLISLVEKWQGVLPNSGIILVTPPQCGATGNNPLSSFRDVMRDVSIDLGVEYYSMFDFMNTTFDNGNALGLWVADGLHLTNVGAQILSNEINKHFMGL